MPVHTPLTVIVQSPEQPAPEFPSSFWTFDQAVDTKQSNDVILVAVHLKGGQGKWVNGLTKSSGQHCGFAVRQVWLPNIRGAPVCKYPRKCRNHLGWTLQISKHPFRVNTVLMIGLITKLWIREK